MNPLRRYKWTYELYNLFQKSALKHNIPLYKKYGINKKYFSSISSEDFKHLDSPPNYYDVYDSADELPNDAFFNTLNKDIQDKLLPWSKDGYAVLPAFYSEDEIESFNTEIERLDREKKANWRYGNRIMFAIHQSKLLHNAGANDRLIGILNMLMHKEVDLFQSINFFHGSQQKTHSDFVHMTTFPYGNLIAVWVALEDITMENGPLHYYPGSHKLPYIFNRDYDNVGTSTKLGKKLYVDYEAKVEEVVAQHPELKKEIFLAKKGDILIWHGNLLHGGEPVTAPGLTRKSMVFHYYTTDAICFHEISQRPTLKR